MQNNKQLSRTACYDKLVIELSVQYKSLTKDQIEELIMRAIHQFVLKRQRSFRLVLEDVYQSDYKHYDEI